MQKLQQQKRVQGIKRTFKGVWIPREIWLSKDLKTFEKVLLTEINSLDNENGCIAGNKYFANFFGISTRQISTYIANLQKKKYIKSTIIGRNKRVIKMEENFYHDGRKLPSEVGRKLPHSNTSKSNTLSNKIYTIDKTKKSYKTECKRFFEEPSSNNETQHAVLSHMLEMGYPFKAVETELRKFWAYWSEPNSTGKKMKWEYHNTFQLQRRLFTWFGNAKVLSTGALNPKNSRGVQKRKITVAF